MSYRMRSWTATVGAVMALGLAPVAIVTIASPAVSWADVCVTGQVLNNVGVCVDAAPPPPQPEGTACVTATGSRGQSPAASATETWATALWAGLAKGV